MRAVGRLPARVASFVAAVLALWLAAVVLAPRLGRARRRRLAAWLARRTLAALGVSSTLRGGDQVRATPRLIVANHISWLDVYALGAIATARFVAKAETRRWPIVGTIAARFDSLFIVRGSFRDAARVRDAVAAALRAGETVVVFPEGATTDGTRLRPFHPALFQAAIDAGVPVEPVAIRYPGDDGRPDLAAAFVDDITFVGSLARVIVQRRISVELSVGPPIDSARCTRRELAALARRHIAGCLAAGGCLIEADGLPRPRRMKLRSAAGF